MAKTTQKIEPKEELAPITSFVDTARDDDDVDFGPIVPEELPEGARERYFEAVGRRKEAIARVRLMTRKAGDPESGDRALLTVNGRSYLEYFTDAGLQSRVETKFK